MPPQHSRWRSPPPSLAPPRPNENIKTMVGGCEEGRREEDSMPQFVVCHECRPGQTAPFSHWPAVVASLALQFVLGFPSTVVPCSRPIDWLRCAVGSPITLLKCLLLLSHVHGSTDQVFVTHGEEGLSRKSAAIYRVGHGVVQVRSGGFEYTQVWSGCRNRNGLTILVRTSWLSRRKRSSRLRLKPYIESRPPFRSPTTLELYYMHNALA